MAEDKEAIQARMLSNISNEYDKTDGSFIYDVEKPVAIELEKLSIRIDEVLNNGFADTATGVYLDKVVNEQGVYRKQATKATGIVTITGVTGAVINTGELIASDSVNFIFTQDAVIPDTKTIDIPVECEVSGTVGNVPVGAVKYFPKTLEGLQTVTNKEALTNGYDTETDDSLRERYYSKVRTPTTSGNKYHYLNWAKEVTGVGDAKVMPLWNGNGTVKVIVINSNKRAADETLINTVSNYIEDNRPIGASLTVISAIEKPINISATLVIDENNYALEEVKQTIEKNLTEYFKAIAFKDTYVSYAKIGNIIIESDGVLDYNSLLINNGTSNIAIADDEVAILGGVTLG